MLATMDFEIMDLLDSLNDMVMNTEEYKNYCKYKGLLDTDDEVRNMIKHFARLKEDFIDVERFGKYHPDFSSKRREINQYKKMLDERRGSSREPFAEVDGIGRCLFFDAIELIDYCTLLEEGKA